SAEGGRRRRRPVWGPACWAEGGVVRVASGPGTTSGESPRTPRPVEPRHSVVWWKARRRGSISRLPPGKRGLGLQCSCPLPRELEPHHQVTYQSLEPQHLVVGCSPFAGLQACLAGGTDLVARPRERFCRHAVLAR